MGRILGIDVGTKRVGVAISDVNRSVASPHATLEEQDLEAVAVEVGELVVENDVDEVVVGWPLHLDGTEGRAVDLVRTFLEALEAELERRGRSVPLEKWDERMSSQGAESALLEADMSRDRRRSVIDRVAAAKILQSYLDSLD